MARATKKSRKAVDPESEVAGIAALLERIRSIPAPGIPDSNEDADPERPTKRHKNAKHESVTVAREQLLLPLPDVLTCADDIECAPKDVGNILDVQFENPGASSKWQLRVTPRSKPQFCATFTLNKNSLTTELESALHVVHAQGVDPGEEGCVWGAVTMVIRKTRDSTQLVMNIKVKWNDRLTVWGSKKAGSDSQQRLQDKIISTWYPDLGLLSSQEKQPSWSPQDFYEAAFVPDKHSFDAEVTALEVPQLETKLYPFQRRAVQWLLRREGVQWQQELSDGEGKVVPYTPSTALDGTSGTFRPVKDLDGNTIHLSPVLHTFTRSPALISSIEFVRGGILAEEMGLGKTLEVISLILLHPRPESPLLVFDYSLGREILSTSATLIISPDTLLDQWLSEIARHAPALRVLNYLGLKNTTKQRGGESISAEYLAQHDVVVTTYEVLRQEIWAASDRPQRSMRNEKQYETVKSPLVQLSWWRVCSDEAQMVENAGTNAARMAQRIPRLNAWGITGTPVKDDVQKDLRGLLLFLRYDLYASDTKSWNTLSTRDKQSFRNVFHSICLRHTKALVRDEITIPPQKRYVISMPFTAVEQQHYESLFKELVATCGLDRHGNPIDEDWDPEDPSVQSAMRMALDRLRQTVLHPEVGPRNRRALGKKAGPMRTVAEVLDAMLDQSDGALRADQRAFLSQKLQTGQILAHQKRVKGALKVWEEVLEKASETVLECREQAHAAAQQASTGQKDKSQGADRGQDEETDIEDDDEGDGGMPSPVKEARRRLRLALEIQHTAVFFCANAYFSLKSDETLTAPGSEDFKKLEELEVKCYDRAKMIRKEILQESHGKATVAMKNVASLATNQEFTVIPEFKFIAPGGLETNRIAEALEEIGGALNEQANMLDEWREHVVQSLLKPLVDEENEEVTGEEYDQSTKIQDEILAYLQALRTALADRSATITGLKNFLVDHETKVAKRTATAGDGPSPEKLLELLKLRDEVKPPYEETYNLSSLRGIVSELRGLTTKLRTNAAQGSSRAEIELEIANNLLKSTLAQQNEQAKALTAMEKEAEKFMDTLNVRLEFYRQLQAVSDMVGEYEGPTDEASLDLAFRAAQKQEDTLQNKLAAAEAKHRYLLHLKEAETGSEEQRQCVICQSSFSIGVLTVCGHQFCKECITLWFKAHHNCPICKRRLTDSNLHDITLKPQELKLHQESDTRDSPQSSPSQSFTASARVPAIYSEFNADQLADIKNIDLDGPNFTTKVDTLVRHILWLRGSDPGAKSIVFSQYKEFLAVVALAFQRYRIGYTSFDKANGITKFKEDPGTEVFLLSARAHASGLNLVNASHVFLCEPLLNTALELQAIARVHRIGQQHETTVWLYIVEGTVEESIYKLSVQRRLEHMGNQSKNGISTASTGKAKGKESDPVLLLDASLDAANSLEMQQARLTKLMGKDGIVGEAVDKKDLWTCLFGNSKDQERNKGDEARLIANPALRGFLAAEAAEERRVIDGQIGSA
ncbi:putative ATP-dependent helicase IRC20 [Podospora australis]|uniref:ATP-dependent helicase IRC20 n=1 Tax=Podospora australis TaxID=1536484 RepID=A0AAN7ALD6_9PEZI|nr:putative ATP-dependent helicase IRC20 [Podospora australis]